MCVYVYIYIYTFTYHISLPIYIYIYIYTHIYTYTLGIPENFSFGELPPDWDLGKGQMGSALMGPLQISCFPLQGFLPRFSL